MLDIGKIEAGQLDIEHTPFSLDDLLTELCKLFRLRAHDKGLRFITQQSLDIPSHLIGDPGRLRQILNNLFSNALKFTRQGEFGLSIERRNLSKTEASEQTVTLCFSVHDTGVGITPEVQKKLFTRFTQADSSTTREFGGSGLGLAIVKQLCEHLGGKVMLSSTPGQGSVFSCELQFTLIDQPAGAPNLLATTVSPVPELRAPASNLQTQALENTSKILMAEDNPINQIVAQALLQQIGYSNVTVVDNGQAAVIAVLAGGFDVILMDCRMPVLDGYDATAKIRALDYHLPIIAMTANVASSELEKCLHAGMNDYISKPFNAATLRQALSRWTMQTEVKIPKTGLSY